MFIVAWSKPVYGDRWQLFDSRDAADQFIDAIVGDGIPIDDIFLGEVEEEPNDKEQFG